MKFIANNDIPRVSTMLNVLHKQGHGVHTILEKLSEAAKNVYHCKSYSQLEYDLSTFILRSGNIIKNLEIFFNN